MYVLFEDIQGNEIQGFHVDNFCAIVGQTVNLVVRNNNPAVWNVEPMDKTFRINRVETKIEQTYPFDGIVSRVSTHVLVSVTVSEI